MNTIAIDCGASFIKGGLFRDGKLIRQISMPTPQEEEKSVFAAVKIKGVLSTVHKVIAELGKRENQATLCISNEMHGFVLADLQNETATEYISWQWELGAVPVEGISSVQWLQNEIDEEDLLHTGMPLRSGLPSSNLAYLRRTRLLEKIPEGIRFYTLGDYILSKLSGQQPHIHPTNAAATGLYDLRSGNWNFRLTEAVSGGLVSFPAIGSERLKFQLDNLSLTASPAIGDQQAALLGVGMERAGDISFNLGTGAQVSVLSEMADVSSAYQIRPYFGGWYLKTLPHIPCGRAMNVWSRFVGDVLRSYGVTASDDEIWRVMTQLGEDKLSGSLYCDLSFFENAVTEHTTGDLRGIEEYNLSLANLAGAIFRQVADNALSAADRLQPRTEVERLLLSGGVLRKNRGIRQRILEAYPHKNYHLAENETLWGLYRYAMLASGEPWKENDTERRSES